MRLPVFPLSRSLLQIKNHGQKIVKKLEAGEDIFAPLKVNSNKDDTLDAPSNNATLDKLDALSNHAILDNNDTPSSEDPVIKTTVAPLKGNSNKDDTLDTPSNNDILDALDTLSNMHRHCKIQR